MNGPTARAVLRCVAALVAVVATVCKPTPAAAGPGLEAIERHPSVGVVSAWLGNGIRVHARSMPTADRAAVAVTLAGGVSLETPDARGVASLIAGAALGRGVYDGVTPGQADAELAARGVQIRSSASAHEISVELSGPAGELSWMLEQVAGLLRAPVVDEGAAAAWRAAVVESGDTQTDAPEVLARERLLTAMYGRDALFVRSLADRELENLTPAAARGWSGRLVTDAPAEIAIASPAGWIEIMRAAETQLAPLPDRPRIAPRDLPAVRPAGPFEPVILRTDAAPRAHVIVGIPAPGMDRMRDLRAMILARDVLAARLPAPASAAIFPGEPMARRGLLFCSNSGSPDEADRLAVRLAAEFNALAAAGPGEDELRAVKASIDDRLAADLASPEGWARRLSTVTRRGTRIAELGELRRRYASITAGEIRAVLRAALDEVGGAGGLLVIQAVGAEAP